MQGWDQIKEDIGIEDFPDTEPDPVCRHSPATADCCPEQLMEED